MCDRASGESSMNFKTMCAVKKEKEKTSHVFKCSLCKKFYLFWQFLEGLDVSWVFFKEDPQKPVRK